MDKASCGNPLVDLGLLAFEAQEVIFLRMAKLAAGGPAAGPEAVRMVAEKARATVVACSLMLDASMRGTPCSGAQAVVDMLRHEVRSNHDRLLA